MNFDNIRESMEKKDESREIIIKESRRILKKSKETIYMIHRGEIDKAKKNIENIKKEKKVIESKIDYPELRTNGFSSACEEYAEATLFLNFVENKEFKTIEELEVKPEEYLGGMADLTGELGRRAVLLGTERKIEEVKKIRDIVDNIFGEFIKFNFRNGDLRRKYDSIKYNLQKIEKILYDLKINK